MSDTVKIPTEPTDEIIRAMLAVEYPALYRDSLYTEFDGRSMRAVTGARIEKARAIYAVIVQKSKNSD